MKHFWAIALIGLIVFNAGCGKKQESASVIEPEAAVMPAELPVLDQNKVAPNPFITAPRDISFEPVNDDAQKNAPVDELAETEVRTGD